jgi:nitroreductase
MSRLDPVARTIRARRMVRSYTDDPVDDALLADLLDLARRAPSAGNTQPCEFLVLVGADVGRYWDRFLVDHDGFRWQGLLRAPVLVVPYVRPRAYTERYAEPDKASTGLGDDLDAWSVPYWWVDGGAAVQNLLLSVAAAGLGACLFGQFEHEAAVRETFGVPGDRRALGTVAIGHPAADEPGQSASRARVPVDEIIHRSRW